MSRHIGFESWVERDTMMLLDFSRKVRAFSAQPFWLLWPAGGKVRRHAPDLFVRLADGGGVVVDVRPDDRIEPEDAEAFEATAAACGSVGWGYRRVGVPDPVLAGNVRWLAGYRYPRCLRGDHQAGLLEAFAVPRPLLDGAMSVVTRGDFGLLSRGVMTVTLRASMLRRMPRGVWGECCGIAGLRAAGAGAGGRAAEPAGGGVRGDAGGVGAAAAEPVPAGGRDDRAAGCGGAPAG
jgi:hypothetical protein